MDTKITKIAKPLTRKQARKHLKKHGNLEKLNLAGCDLSNLNLENISFADSNLTGVNFHNTNIRGANLANCNLQKVILSCAITRQGSHYQYTGYGKEQLLATPAGWLVVFVEKPSQHYTEFKQEIGGNSSKPGEKPSIYAQMIMVEFEAHMTRNDRVMQDLKALWLAKQ